MQALYITRVSEISDITSSSASSLVQLVLLTVLVVVDLDDSSVIVFPTFSVAPPFFPEFLAVV